MRFRSPWVPSVLFGALLFAVLGTWSPSAALAAGKSKKPAAAASESKSADELMEEAVKDKPKSKSGKKNKDKDKAAEADKPAAPPEKKEEPIPEPDAWEKPPAEAEKAPVRAAPPKPVIPPTIDDKHFEAGLVLGYGFSTDNRRGSTNAYGLGFGVRLGYEFDFHLFVGAGFQYYLGGSGDDAFLREVSSNYMLGHIEVGYDVWFDKVIFRPSVLLGIGFYDTSYSNFNMGPDTIKDFFFAPGASILYVMSPWYIGGDLRLVQVTGDGTSAVTLLANVGLRF